MKKKSKKDYRRGVKDSLRLLHLQINTLDHGTGFRASQAAQDHSDMLKHLYNNIVDLLDKE